MTSGTGGQSRAGVIADTAISLIAAQGLRGLTHRAVDSTAGIPQGSTSYYAPTRQALLGLAASRLAQRSGADSGSSLHGLETTVPDDAGGRIGALTAAATELMDSLVGRPVDMRARYALLIELPADDELHRALSSESDVQARAAAAIELVLSRFGVSDPGERARELMRLIDALVFTQIATPSPDARREAVGALAAYLRGIM
ncbi:TetR/AcrR family transcriptional regulator [Williamsia muralis]|uniref:TetR/AcrR family transcriptional regulator n=1 Tax=Williamsia marianensis TaxID=85044 RepID=UPI00380789C0